MTPLPKRPHPVWADLDALAAGFAAPARTVGFADTAAWRPPSDVYETDDAFYVLVDLAALEPGDIHVEMEGEILSVSGVRRDEARGKRTYHVMEIQFGPFERRFRIAHPIDAAGITATYEHGCLEIRLPKAAALPVGRREIPIR